MPNFEDERPYSGNGASQIPRKYSLKREVEVRIETFVSEEKGSLESFHGELILAFGVIAESRHLAFVYGGAWGDVVAGFEATGQRMGRGGDGIDDPAECGHSHSCYGDFSHVPARRLMVGCSESTDC